MPDDGWHASEVVGAPWTRGPAEGDGEPGQRSRAALVDQARRGEPTERRRESLQLRRVVF